MPPPQVYGYHLPQGSIAGSGGLQPGNRTPHTTYPSGGLPGTARPPDPGHGTNVIALWLIFAYCLRLNA